MDPAEGRGLRFASLLVTLALIGVATWISVVPSGIGVIGIELSKVRDTCAAAAAALVALGLPAAQLAFNFGDEFSDRAYTVLQANFSGRPEREAAAKALEQTYHRYLIVVVSLWNIYIWASGSLLICLFGMADTFKIGSSTRLDRTSILVALWMLVAAVVWAIPLLWHALSTREMSTNLKVVTGLLRRSPPVVASSPAPAPAAAPAPAPAAADAAARE